MRRLIFDTGPVINLTLNNLLWLLGTMNKKFKGDFSITPGVKRELIDKPLSSKKFSFEALQLIRAVRKKYLSVFDAKGLHEQALHLMGIANNVYFYHDRPLQILHYAEMESLVAALKYNADAMVVDERTLRVIVEKPEALASLLRRRLHTNVKVDKQSLKRFKDEVGSLRLIRSIELVTVAYEMGLLDLYIPSEMANGRRKLLSSLLWAFKLNGCAVTREEIDEILRYVKS
ncbi:hypothetical protein KY328_00370 [Candidatus Woesearchaeota archaeon]|nr:hypothetical protein [Candidatus Woesearchaeota archaeon]